MTDGEIIKEIENIRKFNYTLAPDEVFDRAIAAIKEHGVLEQIMWERDVAIQQLKDLGYALGEKPKERKGEWIAYDHGMGLVYLKCPFCGTTIDKRHVEHNFCGKCGAKLSGEKSGFER